MQQITQAQMDALATMANQCLLPVVNNPANVAVNFGYGYGLYYDKYTNGFFGSGEAFPTWVNPQPAYSFTRNTWQNLVPPTAHYDGSGNYTLNISTAGDYIWQRGANDTQIVMTGGFYYFASANNFYMQPGTITLQGQPGTLVTSIVTLSPFNWLYELNRIRTDAMNFLLPDGASYTGTSGIAYNPAAICSGPWIVGVNDSVAFPLNNFPASEGGNATYGVGIGIGYAQGVLMGSYNAEISYGTTAGNAQSMVMMRSVKFYSQSSSVSVDTCRYAVFNPYFPLSCVAQAAGTWNLQSIYSCVSNAGTPTLADFTISDTSTYPATWSIQTTALSNVFLIVGTVNQAIAAGTYTVQNSVTAINPSDFELYPVQIISKLVLSTATTTVAANCICPSGTSYVTTCNDFPANSDFILGGSYSAGCWILETPTTQGVWAALTLPVPAINCYCDQDMPPYIGTCVSMPMFEYIDGTPVTGYGAVAGNNQTTGTSTNPFATTMRQVAPVTLTNKIEPILPGISARPTKWLARRSTDFVPYDLGFNEFFGNYSDGVYSNQTADASGDLTQMPFQAVGSSTTAIKIRLVQAGTAIPGWASGTFQYGEALAEDLTIYVKQSGQPTKTSYDFKTTNNAVTIPTDGGGGYLAGLLNNGFNFAVQSNSGQVVDFDVYVEIDTGTPIRIYHPPCGECYSYVTDGKPGVQFGNISYENFGSYVSKPIPQSGYCIFQIRATRLSTPNEAGIYTIPQSGSALTITIGQNVLSGGSLTFQSLGITATIPATAGTSGDVAVFIPCLAGNELVYECSEQISLEAWVNWQPVFFNSLYAFGQFPLSAQNNNYFSTSNFTIPNPTAFLSALSFINYFNFYTSGWLSPYEPEGGYYSVVVFPLFYQLYLDTVQLLILLGGILPTGIIAGGAGGTGAAGGPNTDAAGQSAGGSGTYGGL